MGGSRKGEHNTSEADVALGASYKWIGHLEEWISGWGEIQSTLPCL